QPGGLCAEFLAPAQYAAVSLDGVHNRAPNRGTGGGDRPSHHTIAHQALSNVVRRSGSNRGRSRPERLTRRIRLASYRGGTRTTVAGKSVMSPYGHSCRKNRLVICY